MGSCYQEATFKKRPTQKDYDNLVERAAWDYGHAGYSGTFAEAGGTMQVLSRHFGSFGEAQSWVQNHHEKWDPGILVSYSSGDETRWYLGAWCSS